MRIILFPFKNNIFLNPNYKENNYFRFQNSDIGDTFSFSGRGHKLPPISDEMKEKIISYYKAHKNEFGAIKKFCDENPPLKIHQFRNVVKKAGLEIVHSNSERRKEIDQKKLEAFIEAKAKGESPSSIRERLGLTTFEYRKYSDIGNVNRDKKNIDYDGLKPKIKDLREQGKTNKEIADILGIAVWIVSRIVKLNPDIGRRKHIQQNQQNVNLEQSVINVEQKQLEIKQKIIDLRTKNPFISTEEMAKELGVAEKYISFIIGKFHDIPRKHRQYIPNKNIEVIKLLASYGYNQKQIARILSISPSTVSSVLIRNNIVYADKFIPFNNEDNSIQNQEISGRLKEENKRQAEIKKIREQKKLEKQKQIEQNKLEKSKLSPEREHAEQKKNELNQKIIEHFKNSNGISVINFCKENGIPVYKYKYVVKTNIPDEERKKIIEAKQKKKHLQRIKQTEEKARAETEAKAEAEAKARAEAETKAKEIAKAPEEARAKAEAKAKAQAEAKAKAEAEAKQQAESNKKILEHFKEPDGVSVAQFCKNNKITPYIYNQVVKNNIPDEERKKIIEAKQQRKLEIQKNLQEQKAAKQAEIKEQREKDKAEQRAKKAEIKAKEKAEKEKLEQQKQERLEAEKNAEINQLKKDLPAYELELSKVKIQYEKENNVIIKVSLKRRINFLQEKVNNIKDNIERLKKGLPSIPYKTEFSLFEASDINAENLGLSSNENNDSAENNNLKPQKFTSYILEVKKCIDDLSQTRNALNDGLNSNKTSLLAIKNELEGKIKNYSETSQEVITIKSLIKIIEDRITKIEQKLEEMQAKQSLSSNKNQTWLEEKDFANKIFGHDKLLRVSLDSYKGRDELDIIKNEIDNANNRLKAAFPQDIVFWIKDYDVINYGQPSEKYVVKYRIYRSLDGKKVGYFGTNETYTLEFQAARRYAYSNFIEELIRKHKECI